MKRQIEIVGVVGMLGCLIVGMGCGEFNTEVLGVPGYKASYRFAGDNGHGVLFLAVTEAPAEPPRLTASLETSRYSVFALDLDTLEAEPLARDLSVNPASIHISDQYIAWRDRAEDVVVARELGTEQEFEFPGL